MEYIYAVMLLNKAGQTVDEKGVTAVLKAAGIDADAGKVKSLIAALDGVDIADVIANAAAAPVAAAAPAAGGSSDAPAAAPAEEKKKEEAPPAADASAGLGSLF